MKPETIGVAIRPLMDIYRYDFGRFTSRTSIRVAPKFWDEYVAARCRFEILHQTLVEHVRLAKKTIVK